MHTVTFLPFCYPLSRLGMLGPCLYHFIPLLHTCIYHIPISVCYLQRHSFSTCLVSFSTHLTSRSHMGPPNMMYRVLLRQDFEHAEL